MAYEIEKQDGYFEVRVSGETSRYEVLEIIRELHTRDCGKKFPDLWLMAEESQVPFAHFSEIAQAIGRLLPVDAVGEKTAIVAADEFHMAQFEMYRSEASHLPFPIRVFLSRDEAVAWLTSPEDRATRNAFSA